MHCLHIPAGATYLKVYDFYFDICDGNECAAALLAFLASFHDSILKRRTQAVANNKVALEHGDTPTENESLLQCHTEADLEAGVKFFKRRSFKAGFDVLEAKGFVQIMKNPNEKYRFDKRRFFQFNAKEVNKAIALYVRSSKYAESKRKFAGSNGKIAAAISDNQDISSSVEEDKTKKPRSRRRMTRGEEVPMPDEFKTFNDDLRLMAEPFRLGGINVEDEHEAFVARAERDGWLYVDWRGAWRTWLVTARRIAKKENRWREPDAPAQKKTLRDRVRSEKKGE